jgi:hypothetical protein
MTLNSSEYLAIAMGSAMSGGRGHQYEATSTCQHGNNVEQFTIVVHPTAVRWSSTSLKTGRTQSFDPLTLSLHDGEDTLQLSLERIPHSFAEAVQLAFPMSLPIWGRHHDEYHPISAEQYENETVLILRHQKDRGLFGSFVFDPDTGIAKRLATPTRALHQEVKLPTTSNKDGFSFGFVAGLGPNFTGEADTGA